MPNRRQAPHIAVGTAISVGDGGGADSSTKADEAGVNRCWRELVQIELIFGSKDADFLKKIPKGMGNISDTSDSKSLKHGATETASCQHVIFEASASAAVPTGLGDGRSVGTGNSSAWRSPPWLYLFMGSVAIS